MGMDRPPLATALMRVPPTALPSLIVAHEQAVTAVNRLVDNLDKAGRVPQPWTHDPVARDITTRFNDYAVDGAQSAYSCICLYQQELQRVADTLRQMHAAYQAGEDGNAAAMGAS